MRAKSPCKSRLLNYNVYIVWQPSQYHYAFRKRSKQISPGLPAASAPVQVLSVLIFSFRAFAQPSTHPSNFAIPHLDGWLIFEACAFRFGLRFKPSMNAMAKLKKQPACCVSHRCCLTPPGPTPLPFQKSLMQIRAAGYESVADLEKLVPNHSFLRV